jgi:hypothetical protein
MGSRTPAQAAWTLRGRIRVVVISVAHSSLPHRSGPQDRRVPAEHDALLERYHMVPALNIRRL